MILKAGLPNLYEECKPSANPQSIALVVVLVIVIETSQVEHEDENDDEDDPQSRSAESIRAHWWLERQIHQPAPNIGALARQGP